MNKRSRKEIEKDLRKIKEASKKAKTFKELAEMTGLSYMQIKTSLKDHPIIESRVRKNLKENFEKSQKANKSNTNERITFLLYEKSS